MDLFLADTTQKQKVLQQHAQQELSNQVSLVKNVLIAMMVDTVQTPEWAASMDSDALQDTTVWEVIGNRSQLQQFIKAVILPLQVQQLETIAQSTGSALRY